MIDVHCHLEDQSFDGTRDEVIKRARDVGVKAVITSGLGPSDARKALGISDNRFVYASLGVAPYELTGYEEVVSLVRKERTRLVAVGEVGLDFYSGKRETRNDQLRAFKHFIRLSKELDLPIVVHSRSAGKYAIEVLLEEKAQRVLLHAFDGKVGHALRAVDQGFFLSVPPSVVRSHQKQKLVKAVPLQSLMLESDAPVLGPKRDEVNEPKNITVSARVISELKRVSLDRVLESTEAVSKAFFELK